jgi:hypothetical protein
VGPIEGLLWLPVQTAFHYAGRVTELSEGTGNFKTSSGGDDTTGIFQ